MLGTAILLVAILLVAVGVVVTLAALAPPKDTPRRESAPLPTPTIRMEPADGWVVRRELTGEVVARRTATLAFDRTARLAEIAFDDGDPVREGDIIARLDTRRIQARTRELTAQRQEQAARLAEMQSGPRKETIAAARAEVEELGAQLAFLEIQSKRRKELTENGTIADELYDETRHQAEAARARQLSAAERLAELEAGTRQEQIDAQEAILVRLDAQLEDLAIQLEDSRLVAPFAGIVSDRAFDEGSLVTASAPVLRIVEAGELEARIGLPAELARSLEPGQPVTIEAGSERSEAKVRRLLPEIDPRTQTRGVILTLENSRLAPGRIVRLPIEEKVAADGFWLPVSALRDGIRGLWSCLRVGDDGRVRRCDVEILHTDGERAFVRGPLEAGERVVIDAQHKLVPGQRVTPLETDED
ncbi:MAG: efflux RND transporter periplasmic adaptor subunit [Planctomycetota bacterium]